MYEYRPVPKPNHSKVDKPQKINHKRGGMTAKQRGSISPSARKEVEVRSRDCCERCGKHSSQVWTLEMAHIERRWKSEGRITAHDLVRLCGPSTDSTTCHHWADYTRDGRDWLLMFQSKLIGRDVG